jgi:uncharacterized LabA/DUF88 family protein
MAPFGQSLKSSAALPKGRAALFIDGANMYAASKMLGWEIDWQRVLQYYRKEYDLIRPYYYTAIADGESRLRPMADFLLYNGYTVVTKPTKEFLDSEGRLKIKGNMDMEMALDAIDMCSYCSDIILFTGDGDFKVLTTRIQSRGVRVHVVSTIKSNPPMLADELRRQVDFYHELADMQAIFMRNRD